jgi:hypothetical protein
MGASHFFSVGRALAAERPSDPKQEIQKIDRELEKIGIRAQSVLKDLERVIERMDKAETEIAADQARGKSIETAGKNYAALQKTEADLRSQFDSLATRTEQLERKRDALTDPAELRRQFYSLIREEACQPQQEAAPLSQKQLEPIEALLQRRSCDRSKYHLFDFNCHDFADRFMLAELRSGLLVGIVSCRGNLALSDPLQGHTINYILDVERKKACLVEPQDPRKRSCWVATEVERSMKMPDLDGNPEAASAARKLCQDQYLPTETRVLGAGERVATRASSVCAKRMLQGHFDGVKNEAELVQECKSCCDRWQETTRNMASVAGNRSWDRERFSKTCRSFCHPGMLQ